VKTFSMEWIRLRCRRDEDTGCLLWRQGVNPSNAPVASCRQEDGRKPTFQLRRVVWETRNGPIPDGKVVAVTCGHARCLMHLELITKAEVISREWKKTSARAKLTAGATRTGRARGKLDMEKARAIRSSNDTLEVEAAKHGVSITLVSLVRRGERWVEPANPFAGLGG
jgi:hypothetical protein